MEHFIHTGPWNVEEDLNRTKRRVNIRLRSARMLLTGHLLSVVPAQVLFQLDSSFTPGSNWAHHNTMNRRLEDSSLAFIRTGYWSHGSCDWSNNFIVHVPLKLEINHVSVASGEYRRVQVKPGYSLHPVLPINCSDFIILIMLLFFLCRLISVAPRIMLHMLLFKCIHINAFYTNLKKLLDLEWKKTLFHSAFDMTDLYKPHWYVNMA